MINLAIEEMPLQAKIPWQNQPLSRLNIDAEKNLCLIDYNELAINMSPLLKALYLLFLKHPEGISFYTLREYEAEFIQLYTSISRLKDRDQCLKNGQRLLNRQNNSIHEKCSRIKETFTNILPEHIAQHYYIKGARGKCKKIALDPNLVIWA